MATNTSPPGVDEAREVLGLTLEEVAAAIKADYATLYRWREGGTPSPVYRDRLEQLAKLVSLLVQQVGQAEASSWIGVPMAVLDGRTPRDLILAGRAETLLGTLLSRQYLAHALARAPEAAGTRLRDRAATVLWEAEIDAMYEGMQTPEFAKAALRVLDEPMRVPVPAHLRCPMS
jgi:transcriptional regulator with XRE-family HTH domain